MDLIPNEILLSIFYYVSASDLIGLSTLCKKFNSVINQDFKLVKKLRIYFRKSNRCIQSVGSRRYSQLYIGVFFPTTHHSVLEDIGAYLLTVNFRNHKFKLDTIHRILVLTPNVTKLSFERVTLSDVPKTLKQPLPQLKGASLLSSETDPRLYRILYSCCFNQIGITQHHTDGFSRFAELNRFLHSQTILKQLSFDGFFKTSLFTDNTLDNAQFQVENFSINDSMLLSTIHLKTFIEAHAASLRKLEISNIELCDLSTTISKLKHLTHFSAEGTALNYLETMKSIEVLSMTGKQISQEAFMKFPCVKRLKLKHVFNVNVFDIISNDMKELEKLEIVECSINNNLFVESIKELSLHNVRCPTDFFYCHSNIEYLSMTNCSLVDDNTIEEIVKGLQFPSQITDFNRLWRNYKRQLEKNPRVV